MTTVRRRVSGKGQLYIDDRCTHVRGSSLPKKRERKYIIPTDNNICQGEKKCFGRTRVNIAHIISGSDAIYSSVDHVIVRGSSHFFSAPPPVLPKNARVENAPDDTKNEKKKKIEITKNERTNR